MKLYQSLIAPVRPELSETDRLVIIPDDELNYLPFEALQDENKKYLLENFSIQYQYSTSLLNRQTPLTGHKKTLAFAPFASTGYAGSPDHLNALAASRDEISGIKGTLLLDSAATKNNFLAAATHYTILHLATHASVDNTAPSRSFIAFYPGKTDPDFKLYAPEIADLRLDTVQLVILSACETAAGQLIKGEGMMSLSRAFAYAGCPNIIASLWKAEDKTTAFITNRLYHYLDKGYTKDQALQQARLDLLRSDAIEPRFKTPDHWAHLIFIGQYEHRSSSANWWWIAIITAIVLTGIAFFVRRSYS